MSCNAGIVATSRGFGAKPNRLPLIDICIKELNMSPTDQQKIELEAAAFRRLLAHLDANKDVQNIDLMNLAGFCRNCLAKWYAAAADERGLAVDYEQARERVYGMPYHEWKADFQAPR